MSSITMDAAELRKIVREENERSVKTFMDVVSNLVQKVDAVEKKQESLEVRLSLVESGLSEGISDVREEIREQKRRIIRMSNIVVMGIPESDEGLALAQNLLTIIAPSPLGTIPHTRVGDPNGRKPRPLRVSFSSAAARNEVLKNCKKLKGLSQFQGVSVRRDLTKVEQEEWRAKSVARTSGMTTRQSTNNKRKHSGGAFSHSKEMRMGSSSPQSQ